ncbi:hypothetical protein SBRCBS47491_002871 [Sporothrix bragantina]|uniref:Uncharacterized protein n=1 Tax=Sporothrix bragantina TaxID=671064 RepID=A0ABP0BAJ1_9PEZI
MDIDQSGATAPDHKSPEAGLTTDGTPNSTQGTANILSAVNRSSSSGSGSSAAFHKSQPLTKSNSVVSHKSIPFTGAYPIGHLKVHRVSTPEPSISEGHESSGSAKSLIAEQQISQASSSRASTQPTMKGDAFVLLSIPEEAHVGCDITALTVKKTTATDASFLGFRDLPPGAHFVWLSAPGSMSRQGYWFVTQPSLTPAQQGGVVRVKQWDRFNEVLGECASQYEARSLADDLASVYPRLLAYNSSPSNVGNTATTTGAAAARTAPYLGPPLRDGELAVPEAGVWSGLTSCITERLLARVTGQRSSSVTKSTTAGTPVVTGTTATTHTEWLVSTTDTAKGEMTMPLRSTTNQFWGNGGSAEFLFLFAKDDLDPYQLLASRDKAKSSNNGQSALSASPPTSSGQASSSDTTERIISLLEELASRGLGDKDLVGELQFAFLTGTLLSNLSCLEQWWHLVLKIYLRANSLVSRRPVLCRLLLQTLHCQFLYLERHVAGGFLGHTSSTGTTNKAAGASNGSARASAGSGASTVNAATEADGGGTGLFEAKPQGAMRLQASLTEFKRHLNETLLGLGKAASPDAAAVGEAFAGLEASLWRYGWDLRSDYVSGGSVNNNGNEDGSDSRGGRWGDPADNDDADGEMDYYEEAINRTTGSKQKPHRHHTGLSDTDSDSDQPVLVELDEDGREIGLVSWN